MTGVSLSSVRDRLTPNQGGVRHLDELKLEPSHVCVCVLSENGRTADALGVPRVSKMKKKRERRAARGCCFLHGALKWGQQNSTTANTASCCLSFFPHLFVSRHQFIGWLGQKTGRDFQVTSAQLRAQLSTLHLSINPRPTSSTSPPSNSTLAISYYPFSHHLHPHRPSTIATLSS